MQSIRFSTNPTFLLSIMDKLLKQNGVMDFRSPQIDIANYLAMSPETVCQSLRKWQVIEMPNHECLANNGSQILDMIAHNGLADR